MSAPREFSVGEHRIGGPRVFIVAEAGVNHNGELDLALRLVDAAAEAGADAVKFQTFRTDALVSAAAPKARYQQETTGSAETQSAMLARLELGPDAHARLRDHAARRGIVFFSTPFDEASADVLDQLGVPLFKVPSGEVTNVPLLRHVAAKGKPILVSTGMCTLDEVAVALDTIAGAGDPPVAVLHCVSAYPAPAEETNLRAMDTLRTRFRRPVGLSDHTLGVEVALAAVARGAAVLEKHVTLDRTLPGPDHRASLEPADLTRLVRGARIIEAALGDGDKRPMPCELDTRAVARRSLVATRALPAGHRLSRADLTVKRPGTGIPPAELERVIGRTLVSPLAADELLDWKALRD